MLKKMKEQPKARKRKGRKTKRENAKEEKIIHWL